VARGPGSAMEQMTTPDEVREAAIRAVEWLKASRAKAAPDALSTIAYLAAREQILTAKLRVIGELVYGAPDSQVSHPGADAQEGDGGQRLRLLDPRPEPRQVLLKANGPARKERGRSWKGDTLGADLTISPRRDLSNPCDSVRLGASV
jgi:hypothetical protein